ncbi:MAG: glycosyltransferase family 4 protein, partial [Planctomycetaceae bacterium]|nr:glycosyltransferase family 4 protein [Planctomycetaceae bacterium]
MRILFFSHYFPPEGNAPASRTYEHCVRWVKAGHQVTVVTCVPNVPNGVPYEGYRNRLRSQQELVDGIEVIRVWTFLAANAGFAKRILNYLSFLVTATWAGLFVRRPDVVIATSPQFFCGWAGVLVQAIRRLPFVLEIRDIWPESITAVGAMKKGLVTRLLEWLERKMYRSADHIVAVGNGYADNVASKVPVADRISVIYNGVDGSHFTPAKRNDDFLKSVGMQDRFVCAYVGTIGMAHGLETVLDAAELLVQAGRNEIGFLLVGDGARREYLESLTAERGLSSMVAFTGRLDKSAMPLALASSDCLLVHLRPCDLFSTVIPSKIFEAMAMERAIIMGVPGESAQIVERSGAGIAMIPGNAESLVQCVTALCDDPALRKQLEQCGRSFVLEQFSRDAFAREYLGILLQVAQQQPEGSRCVSPRKSESGSPSPA